jgi:uncharacterized protein (DUF1501 family)
MSSFGQIAGLGIFTQLAQISHPARLAFDMDRRSFLMGCSSAIAALSGGRLSSLAFAESGTQDEVMVVVFLRGGWDVLSVMPPIDGPDRGHYEQARPRLRIPTSGNGAALKLDAQFGLHPSLEKLFERYKAGNMAIVTATGMVGSDTRSHFDAMEYMELGTPGARTTPQGWVTRLLENTPKVNSVLSNAVAIGSSPPTALQGYPDAVAMMDLNDFKLTDDENHRKFLHGSLARLWSGDTWLHQSGQATLKAIEAVAKAGFKAEEGGLKYPETEFAASLSSVARMIKRGLGLRVATVDLGGWDTHQYQGNENSQGYLADLLKQLSEGLATFYADLERTGLDKKITVVVQSEFGRRLDENASYGTDHGHGSAMFVLGGNVVGGKVYGKWPGLATDQLFERADLEVTTDYRTVFSEVIDKRFGVGLEKVFPDFKPGSRLGLLR